MDPIRNPYTPGAGTRPSELAGRDEEIGNFKILLARLRTGRPEQSQIITGLRGVGKTVLLNTFEDLAEGDGYLTVFRELTQETSLPQLLAKDTQRLLRDLKLSVRLADAVRTGLSTLTAFKLTDPNGFELSVDLKKLQEQHLTDDLIELFLQLGRAAQAKKVGININLTTHPFGTVISTAVACQPSQPTCKWQAENWGAGWIYGPSYLPTGEQLFAPGAVANYGSYNDASTTQLISEVTVASNETQELDAYAQNVSQRVPVVFQPTSIGTYQGDAGTLVAKNLGGYAANALGLMNPEDWYFTR